MLRIVLVGAGRTVRIGHAPALQALHDRYQVVGVADTDPAVLEEAGILLGLPPRQRFQSYADMLLALDYDIVDIAVPHAFHHEVALAALQHGAHLVSERPLALSLRDADDLLRLAESRGRHITVLHYYLYYPPFREAIRLIRAGAIGDPFLLRWEGVTGGYGPGTDSYHPAWHNEPLVAGGGVWLDSAYHGAYLSVAMMGAPVTAVSARISTQSPELIVDDTAAALLSHDNGGTSSLQVAWSVPSGGRRIFEVYGSEGTLVLDHEEHSLALFANATRTWSYPEVMVDHAASFAGIFAAIHEHLHFGAPPPVSHRDALHALAIILAGYEASRNERVEGIG